MARQFVNGRFSRPTTSVSPFAPRRRLWNDWWALEVFHVKLERGWPLLPVASSHRCGTTGTHVAGWAGRMIGLCVVEVREAQSYSSPPWEWGSIMRFEQVEYRGVYAWLLHRGNGRAHARVPEPVGGAQTPDRYRL